MTDNSVFNVYDVWVFEVVLYGYIKMKLPDYVKNAKLAHVLYACGYKKAR